MTHEEVVQLVGRWQQALQGRDAVTYASLHTDDVLLLSPLAGSLTGKDGLIRNFNAFFTAFPDATFTWEAPIIEGNRVANAGTIQGTDIGGLLGFPPTGKPFRFNLVFLLDLRDGRIARDRRNYDFTGLLVQLGVLKAKPAS